jgi:hypothetical protein
MLSSSSPSVLLGRGRLLAYVGAQKAGDDVKLLMMAQHRIFACFFPVVLGVLAASTSE